MAQANMPNGVELTHRTEANIDFETDESWQLDDADYGEELLEAIQVARDSGNEQFVEPDGPYIFKAVWNEKTESVWVQVYGYSLGLEPVDSNGDEFTRD